MKILDRIKHVSQKVKEDSDAKGPLGDMLQNAAVEAIFAGRDTTQWKTYMSLFADSKEQLLRLNVEDTASQTDKDIKTSIAYLAGNGTCGGMTPLHLPDFVSPKIDLAITNTVPDPTVTGLRPFQVAEPATQATNPAQPVQPANQPQPETQPQSETSPQSETPPRRGDQSG